MLKRRQIAVHMRADDHSSSASHLDLQELHSFSRCKRTGSSRSISSFTTDRSSATCVASNTTRSREHKKRQKRIFRAFANWLMRFLEKKDPRVFGEAQAVIRDCEQRKKRGEIGFESVTESLKEPLREVVGRSYWKEAQYMLNEYIREKSQLGEESRSLSNDIDDHTMIVTFSRSESSTSSTASPPQTLSRPTNPARVETSPLSTNSAWNLLDEKRIRRERFYLILRVLMKYLETSNPPLYSRAREAINDCVTRHDNHEDGKESLCESIKRKVKQVVGDTNWRKAEAYLSREIMQQAHKEARREPSRRGNEHRPLTFERVVIHTMATGDTECQGQETELSVDLGAATTISPATHNMTRLDSMGSNWPQKHGADVESAASAACLESKRRKIQTSREGRLLL